MAKKKDFGLSREMEGKRAKKCESHPKMAERWDLGRSHLSAISPPFPCEAKIQFFGRSFPISGRRPKISLIAGQRDCKLRSQIPLFSK